MSLPSYPDYSGSDVPCLDLIPKHWSVLRFKYIMSERDERSISGEEELLSVSAYTGVSPRREIIDDGDHLSRAESLEGYKVCYPKDLVMNIMLAWNRGLAFTDTFGIVSPAYAVFKLESEDNERYLNYLLRTNLYTHYFKMFSSGVIESRLRLYPDVFLSLRCVVPPIPEQVAIADFLDRETAKIDRLIAAATGSTSATGSAKSLVGLLLERRSALITAAVTGQVDVRPILEKKQSQMCAA